MKCNQRKNFRDVGFSLEVTKIHKLNNQELNRTIYTLLGIQFYHLMKIRRNKINKGIKKRVCVETYIGCRILSAI